MPSTTIKHVWPAVVFWLVLALMPIGRASALAVLIMLIGGITLTIKHRRELFGDPTVQTFLALFACFWLPIAASSVDAYKADKALSTTLAMLRFLPVGFFVIWWLRDENRRAWVIRWTTWLLVFWCLDALVQAMVGQNVFGMPHPEDRLNGIFDDNLKLGPVAAATSAIALDYARRRWSALGIAALYSLLLVVILLAGTRSAWVMFAVTSACFVFLYWRQHGLRKVLPRVALAGAATLALFAAAYAYSPTFEQRVARSMLLFDGGRANVDAAFSIRLPIWETSIAMAGEHWVNGVGVRSFRYAYEDFAAPDDPWLELMKERGAYHAHQLILEAATETGVLGLLGWLAFAVIALRYWRRLSPLQRTNALPFGIALIAMVFPLNSHFAFYSTFWSLLFWWLVIGWLAFSSATARDAPSV